MASRSAASPGTRKPTRSTVHSLTVRLLELPANRAHLEILNSVALWLSPRLQLLCGAVVAKKKKSSNTHAREQLAALGLFIQNFEKIVATLRGECSRILRGGQIGVKWENPKTHLFQWNICSSAFHHEVMTARPVVEIWQALMAEECRALVVLSKISERDAEAVTEIVMELVNKFRALNDIRNRLIHATWTIGRWWPNDTDLSVVHVEKHKVSKEGLQKRDDLPRSFEELLKLGKQAEQLWGKLGRFLQFYIYSPEQISLVFVKSKTGWAFDLKKFRALTAKHKSSPGKSR